MALDAEPAEGETATQQQLRDTQLGQATAFFMTQTLTMWRTSDRAWSVTLANEGAQVRRFLVVVVVTMGDAAMISGCAMVGRWVHDLNASVWGSGWLLIYRECF